MAPARAWRCVRACARRDRPRFCAHHAVGPRSRATAQLPLTCVCPCPAQLAGGCCRAFADISIVVDTSSSYQFQVQALKDFTNAFIDSFDYDISTATAGPYVSLVNFTGGDDWTVEQARAALTPREADAPCRVPRRAMLPIGGPYSRCRHVPARRRCTHSLAVTAQSATVLVPLTTSLTTLEDTVQNDLEAFEDRKTCIKCGIQVRIPSSTPTLPPLTGCRMGPHIACVRRWPIIHTHHVC